CDNLGWWGVAVQAVGIKTYNILMHLRITILSGYSLFLALHNKIVYLGDAEEFLWKIMLPPKHLQLTSYCIILLAKLNFGVSLVCFLIFFHYLLVSSSLKKNGIKYINWHKIQNAFILMHLRVLRSLPIHLSISLNFSSWILSNGYFLRWSNISPRIGAIDQNKDNMKNEVFVFT
ncbi:hypothetical protein ACJX0J_025182, partial [Zea mays]